MATLLCWAWSCPLILLFLASHAQAGLLTKADNEGMKGVDTMEGLVQVDDLDRMSQVEDMDRMAQVDDMEGLVQAHVVFRHGDRTPCNFYPNDPHKDLSEWPVGPGQLTARGKRMHYHLGQWLRKRYSHLLGPDYSETEVLVRSTDVDRTLMSAQSNLAGMFPPTKAMRWLDNFPWQPVPVHTVPQNQDSVLGDKAECPRAQQLLNEVLEGEEMKSILESHSDMLDYISKNSGRPVTNVLELDYLYDTLLVETIYNKTLPEWTKAVFPGGDFERLRLMTFSLNTANHKLARLFGGPFVKEMLEHWTFLIENQTKVVNHILEKKAKLLYVYSGHDTSIATILNSLEVFNGLAPPYASAVLFELLKREEGKHFVRIAYKNDTEATPYPLTLPGCATLCPLEKFKQLTGSLVPEDWANECSLTSPSESLGSGLPFSMQLLPFVALVICTLSLLLLLTALFVRYKSRVGELLGYGRSSGYESL